METTTLILGMIILIIVCIMFFILLKINKSVSPKSDITPELDRLSGRIAERLENESDKQNKLLASGINMLDTNIRNQLNSGNEASQLIAKGNRQVLETGLAAMSKSMEARLDKLTQTMTEGYRKQYESTNANFEKLRIDNYKQIDMIRENVNEKLDKTLNEQFNKNFKSVIEQMSNLQNSMGELKSLSGQVGSLERSLNGIKTKGIIGENQLSMLIEDILAPNQYDIQVPTVPGSREFVEIAIKIPNKDNNSFCYLPVDSKCHTEPYLNLVNARESADKELIASARKAFAVSIRNDAQSIKEKYVREPHTTPYAILFAPFESMYSEIVELDLVEELNRMHITVAGPYTFSAILSTIRNYWQMMAVENKSREIAETLANTKKAFEKYSEIADKLKKNLDQASKNLDDLRGTRTRAINRALKDIDAADDLLTADAALGIEASSFYDDDTSGIETLS